jgi:hypothetical protein
MSLGDLKTPLPKRSVKPLPRSLSGASGFLRRFSTFFTEGDANSFRQMRYSAFSLCCHCSLVDVFSAQLSSVWPMSLLLDF